MGRFQVGTGLSNVKRRSVQNSLSCGDTGTDGRRKNGLRLNSGTRGLAEHHCGWFVQVAGESAENSMRHQVGQGFGAADAGSWPILARRKPINGIVGRTLGCSVWQPGRRRTKLKNPCGPISRPSGRNRMADEFLTGFPIRSRNPWGTPKPFGWCLGMVQGQFRPGHCIGATLPHVLGHE